METAQQFSSYDKLNLMAINTTEEEGIKRESGIKTRGYRGFFGGLINRVRQRPIDTESTPIPAPFLDALKEKPQDLESRDLSLIVRDDRNNGVALEPQDLPISGTPVLVEERVDPRIALTDKVIAIQRTARQLIDPEVTSRLDQISQLLALESNYNPRIWLRLMINRFDTTLPALRHQIEESQGLNRTELAALSEQLQDAYQLVKKVKKQTEAESSAQVEEAVTPEIEEAKNYRYDNKNRSWVEVEAGERAIELNHPFGFLEKRAVLPNNCLSWEKTPKTVEVAPDQLFYLPTGSQFRVPLDKLTIIPLGTGQPVEIYLGVVMANPELTEILQKALGFSLKQDGANLDEGELAPLEEEFFDRLVRNLSNQDFKVLETARSAWTIHTASDSRYNRVYFTQTGNIEGKRVILVIAGCNKVDQRRLFRMIAEG